MKLSIIILDYFKAEKVIKNVKGLLNQLTDFDFDIYIIDNSLNKNNSFLLQTLQGNRNVRVIINKKNEGYTVPHNKLASDLDSNYLLIVNPDIEWPDNKSLQKMVDYMNKHRKVAILAPKQRNEDGSRGMNVRAFPKLHVQIARRTFLRNLPILKSKVRKDEMVDMDYDREQAVDWVQSSCMIVRKEFWDEVGGFNEDYFLFMADVELCEKAWDKGYKVVYNPEVEVQADGLRCSSGGFMAFLKKWPVRQHLKDALRYHMSKRSKNVKV